MAWLGLKPPTSRFDLHCANHFTYFQATDPKVLLEKDFYVWRSYLAQKKYKVVLEEKLPEELSCIKVLAEYLSIPSKKWVWEYLDFSFIFYKLMKSDRLLLYEIKQ